VMAAGAQAPGLSFLRSLNWIEAPVITEDTVLHRVVAALKGEAPAITTPRPTPIISTAVPPKRRVC
jgi:hypothetical protein